MKQIKKECNLTLIELCRFNQMVTNPERFGNTFTAKELGINQTKIESLIQYGHLKKAGICFENGSPVKQQLFEL